MNGNTHILALLLVLLSGYTSGENVTDIDVGELQGLSKCLEDGSPWMVDCNRCTCDNGEEACSDNSCLPNTECHEEAEGLTWNDDCNICACVNGQVSCSDKTCLGISAFVKLSESNIIDHGGFMPGGAGPEHILTEKGIWNPNPNPWFVTFDFDETYKVNYVVIANTGDSVHDVTSFEIESSKDNKKWTSVKVVTNVTSGDKDPQDFSISGEGRYWKLTIKQTSSQYQPWVQEFGFVGYKKNLDQDDQEPVCVDGTSWPEECNTCTCLSGHKACTHKNCVSEKECVENSYWTVDGCNVCSCYSNEVTCSNKNCFSNPATKCKEGSMWKEDCNTCICSDGISTCTKLPCSSEQAEGVFSTTQLPEIPGNYNNGSEIIGESVIAGARVQGLVTNIKIPIHLKGCMEEIDGVVEYFPYLLDCEECAYCKKKTHTYNARTCKCHRKFRG